MTKAELRAEAARIRSRAHAAASDAGERRARNLPLELAPSPGAVVDCYDTFRTEIYTRPLMAALAERGCRLALPTTPPRKSDAGLTFRLIRLGAALAPGAFGVQEPPEDAPRAIPDLVLVPLLAFDRTGARLGYGAGHYDRTLPALAGRAGFRAIGLAFVAQEVERLPAEPHDHPLDGVLTEDGYIVARSL